MERFDYIVLDGINSTWDGTTYKANWDIGDYMFKQYKDDDEVFISLHSCDFTVPEQTESAPCCMLYAVPEQTDHDHQFEYSSF